MTWDDLAVDDNIFTGGLQNAGPNGHFPGQVNFRTSDPITHLSIQRNQGVPTGNGPCVGTIVNAPGAVIVGNTP